MQRASHPSPTFNDRQEFAVCAAARSACLTRSPFAELLKQIPDTLHRHTCLSEQCGCLPAP